MYLPIRKLADDKMTDINNRVPFVYRSQRIKLSNIKWPGGDLFKTEEKDQCSSNSETTITDDEKMDIGCARGNTTGGHSSKLLDFTAKHARKSVVAAAVIRRARRIRIKMRFQPTRGVCKDQRQVGRHLFGSRKRKNYIPTMSPWM